MRASIAALALACLTGCAAHETTILGIAPAIGIVTPIRALKTGSRPVTLHGVMTEKCPVAGCWFMLRDKTGTIKVDTKGAGFTVTDVPVNADVTVSGRLTNAGERMVSATGLRY